MAPKTRSNTTNDAPTTQNINSIHTPDGQDQAALDAGSGAAPGNVAVETQIAPQTVEASKNPLEAFGESLMTFFSPSSNNDSLPIPSRVTDGEATDVEKKDV